VVAVAGAWVTVVAAPEVVADAAVEEVELAALAPAVLVALAAAVPGIVNAPIIAKTAVATLAAAAEPTVRRRRRRRPASRLLGVGVASVSFMSLRMSGPAEGFVRASLESAVKVNLSPTWWGSTGEAGEGVKRQAFTPFERHLGLIDR
jgi:hypothetical protein